ncbi:MAG: TonB-dependent receptor, partial [Acidobacteriota bacterium]
MTVFTASTRIFRCASAIAVAAILTCSAALSAAEIIQGVVLDPDGTPVAGATIALGSGEVTALTMGDGTFSLKLPEPIPSPLRLSVWAPGFEKGTLELEGGPELLEIRLKPIPLFSGEVEVTSNRAQVGETPVTLTNVSREEIARNNWGQDVPLLLQHVPGFYAFNDNGNGMGYSYFFLRGFDMRRTSVSLNGVPLNDAHSHGVYFVDLADFLSTTGDIQVQRGVGTNLFGGSAIGGAVDMRTREPLTEPRLRISASGGSWGTRTSQIEYDSGLIDEEWAATFRYSRSKSDGYRDQSWLDAWNYYATIEHYGRRSTTRLVLFGGPEDTHLAYEGITQAYLKGEITGNKRKDRRHNPLTYPGEIDHFFQPHFQLINNTQLTPDLRLNNTLFYFEGDGFYEQFKEDRWLPEYNLQPYPGPDGDIIDTSDLVRRRQVGEWDAGWIGSVEWRHGNKRGQLQAGLAVRLHSGRHEGTTIWAQHYPPDTPPNHPYYDYRLDKQTYQPFIQEEWKVSDQWRLFGGLTWTSHRYHMQDDQLKSVDFVEDFDFLLPRLGVTFNPGPGLSLYANISRGGREPAFRDIYDPQDFWFGDQPNDLEPEDLTDFELGVQHQWHRGYGRFNLYLLDFDNAIVWAGGLDSDGLPITANGAKTTHKGAELELGWTPRPRFGARLTASYSRATFDDFEEFGWDGSFQDHRGNRIAGTPDWLASLEMTGGWGPVDVVASVRYAGRFFLDNTEDLRKYPELRDDPGYIHRVNEAFT